MNSATMNENTTNNSPANDKSTVTIQVGNFGRGNIVPSKSNGNGSTPTPPIPNPTRDMKAILNQAIAHIHRGISVVPSTRDSEKMVDVSRISRTTGEWKWEEFKSRIPTVAEINVWIDQAANIAQVMGKVSQNEMGIEFDVRRHYDLWRAKVGNLADNLIVEESGRGFHVMFRLDPAATVPHTETLAHVVDESTTTGQAPSIELMGAGKAVICSPSIHHTGVEYKLVQGSWDNIPVLPEAHVNALIQAARELDECPFTKQQIAQQEKSKSKPMSHTAGRNDIGAYNSAHTIQELLERFGYKKCGKRYIRPSGAKQTVVIFDDNRSYHHAASDPLSDGFRKTPFDVLQIWGHGGDFDSALAEARQELGIITPTHKATISHPNGNSASVETKETTAPTSGAGDNYLPLDDILSALSRDETGDAELLKRLHGGHITYDHTQDEWYLFEQPAWHLDEIGVVERYVTDDVASQYLFAAAEVRRTWGESKETQEKVKELFSHASKLRNQRKINNVLQRTLKQDEIALTGREWDKDPYLIATPSGVLDLRLEHCDANGNPNVRKGEPNDYIRLTIPVKWNGLKTECPKWITFLNQIFAHKFVTDPETGQETIVERTKVECDAIVGFLRRWFGYCLTGIVSEDSFVVLHGDEGRNGKRILTDTIAEIMSEHACIGSDDLLLVGRDRSAGSPQQHLVDIAGKRMVLVSETEKGKKFNLAQLKKLSGGDKIPARGMYEPKGKNIAPTWKIILLTNVMPKADASEAAFFERIYVVPFVERFLESPELDKDGKPIRSNEHKRNPHLIDDLRSEHAGIFAWMVKGCLEWQKDGLQAPKEVRAATEEYRAGQNDVKQWFEARCIAGDETHTEQAMVCYTNYRNWCTAMTIEPLTGTEFGKRLGKMYHKKRATNGIVYSGFSINPKAG